MIAFMFDFDFNLMSNHIFLVTYLQGKNNMNLNLN